MLGLYSISQFLTHLGNALLETLLKCRHESHTGVRNRVGKREPISEYQDGQAPTLGRLDLPLQLTSATADTDTTPPARPPDEGLPARFVAPHGLNSLHPTGNSLHFRCTVAKIRCTSLQFIALSLHVRENTLQFVAVHCSSLHFRCTRAKIRCSSLHLSKNPGFATQMPYAILFGSLQVNSKNCHFA